MGVTHMTLAAYLENLKGKSVAVIGIGISNVPLIRLLRAADISVTACDKKDRAALGEIAAELEAIGCKLRLGEDYLNGLCEDVIFRTPGLHPRFLEDAKRRGSVCYLGDGSLFRGLPLSYYCHYRQ